jgi:hypothetical protein
MVKETVRQESALSRFNLGYEYDRTWQEARKEIKARTFK